MALTCFILTPNLKERVKTMIDLPLRLRRLRRTENLRRLIRETELQTNDFIYPLFVKEGLDKRQAISSMPGQFQLCLGDLKQEVKEIESLGIPAVIVFGIPQNKDERGSESFHPHGIVQQAIREIKKHSQTLLVISDICFCEYTDHGHCGMLQGKEVDNDGTLELLGKQAVAHAEAGADILAPSGMMDGMVQAIRTALDKSNFSHLPILSYAVKYASCFYGPFRDAAEGTPQFGDRKGYQMDPANGQEALREAMLDMREGADMLMVKPAMNYLDIIYRVKQQNPSIPLCAYQVSGEYSMIKNAASHGLLDEEQAMFESLTAIKRAGSDFIITYFAKEVCKGILQAHP